MRDADNVPSNIMALFVRDIWDDDGTHLGCVVKHDDCSAEVFSENDPYPTMAHEVRRLFCPECGLELVYDRRCEW